MGGSGQVAAEEKNRWIWLGLILHATVYMHVCVHSKYIHRAACVLCGITTPCAFARQYESIFVRARPAIEKERERERDAFIIYCVCINSACAREVEHWLTGFQHLLAGAAWGWS